jgi:hypothetical protein
LQKNKVATSLPLYFDGSFIKAVTAWIELGAFRQLRDHSQTGSFTIMRNHLNRRDVPREKVRSPMGNFLEGSAYLICHHENSCDIRVYGQIITKVNSIYSLFPKRLFLLGKYE